MTVYDAHIDPFEGEPGDEFTCLNGQTFELVYQGGASWTYSGPLSDPCLGPHVEGEQSFFLVCQGTTWAFTCSGTYFSLPIGGTGFTLHRVLHTGTGNVGYLSFSIPPIT